MVWGVPTLGALGRPRPRTFAISCGGPGVDSSDRRNRMGSVVELIGGVVPKGRGIRPAYRWFSPSEKTAIMLRFREGASAGEVVAEFGASLGHAYALRREAVMSRRRVAQSPHRLSFEERERILIGICRGESNAEIARAIGRHRSTVGREIAKCGRRHHYRALQAERKAQKRARRPKPTKLSSDPCLLAEVERRLSEWDSPEQISARLKLDFPDDPRMRISHETIYQSLYVQARGELRRELSKCLRTGRTHRKPQGRVAHKRIPDMLMISERPAEVEDRAVPGHWEGDLIMGKAGKSQVATLVERSTRFVMLAALDDKTAVHVAGVLAERIQTLPGELRRSLTWDQGTELSEHQAFSISSGVPVYFCDPHSPWQRGSNENTNGLLRQYFPKGTDLSIHTQDELDRVAAQLNGRPRKTLEWLNPAEKLRELLDR
jgi:IS30 family transposase